MAFLRHRALRCVLALAALAGAVRVSAQDGRVEDEVKAVFLLNFSKYVSWPPSTFADRSWAPIRLCVAASAEFVETVKAAAAGESVDGHTLVTIAVATIEEARECQVLFVAKSDSLRMRPVLEALRTTPVLTIVDQQSLRDPGTVIALVRDQNRVRFDVNRAAAQAKGLSISAKLLRVARRVEE